MGEEKETVKEKALKLLSVPINEVQAQIAMAYAILDLAEAIREKEDK